MEFKITIRQKDFTAKLADSEMVRQLAEQLPAEVDFERSGNHEFYCRLAAGLNIAGEIGTSDFTVTASITLKGGRHCHLCIRI